MIFTVSIIIGFLSRTNKIDPTKNFATRVLIEVEK
jgi:hypothetical protein